VNGALGGAGKALGSAAEAAAAASAAASQAVGGTVGAAQGFVEAAAAEFNTEISIIQDNIDSLVGGVQAAVGGAVSGAVDQVAGLLPPEVQSALGAGAWAWAAPASHLPASQPACLLFAFMVGTAHQLLTPLLLLLLVLFLPVCAVASTAVGAAREAVALTGSTDNTTVAVTAGLGLGLPALAAWRAAYGGFAGVLPPAEALKLLQSGGDVVLLDVRTEAVRSERGVVELKRGALGKGAAVPPVQVGPPACPAPMQLVLLPGCRTPVLTLLQLQHVQLQCKCPTRLPAKCPHQLILQHSLTTQPLPLPLPLPPPSLCRSCCPVWRGVCATPLLWLLRFRPSRWRRCPRSGQGQPRSLSSTHRFVHSWRLGRRWWWRWGIY
jgi:hypothetical protein